MGSKVRHGYHLVDESPWPFLVSTASLFLTLGAVSFLDFFVFVDHDFSFMLVSFMSLAQKAKSKVLYEETLIYKTITAQNNTRDNTSNKIEILKEPYSDDN